MKASKHSVITSNQRTKATNRRHAFRKAVGTLAAAGALVALAGIPGRANCTDTEVFLYALGGDYYAAGYSVYDQHVLDPEAVQVGTVDANGIIWDSQNNVIGFVSEGV